MCTDRNCEGLGGVILPQIYTSRGGCLSKSTENKESPYCFTGNRSKRKLSRFTITSILQAVSADECGLGGQVGGEIG